MSFRIWLEQLRSVRGHRPLWPVLLGATLDAEFQRQVLADECYSGEVFIDRDEHPLGDGEREERLVARLYRNCLNDKAAEGCITLNGHRIWLLGYQWPNQGGVREKKRQADLVGITLEGGLVVFEAKRAKGDAPLIAIAEGLDYLACLLRARNFAKIENGFQKWKAKPGKTIPAEFTATFPRRDIRPAVIVLAPDLYYHDLYSRSIRGKDWPYLAAIGDAMVPSVRLAFAATDFASPDLRLLSGQRSS